MIKIVYMSVLKIKPTYYLGEHKYKIGDKVKFKTVTAKRVTGIIKEIGLYDYVNKEILGHFRNNNEIEYALKNSNNALMSATIEIQDSNYNKAVKGRELTIGYDNILRKVK